MGKSPYDPEELEELFAQALERGRRNGVLSETRARHPPLAAELEALLAAHDRGCASLDEPLALTAFEEPASGAPLRPEDWIGTSLGDYAIVRKIGDGGTSTVFEAEQKQPRRRVALKVLRDPEPSPTLRARFASEAETLAHLEHPGIARVYGSGTARTERGACSWIAMEHIPDALPVTEYAAAFDLDETARARLLVRIAEAVHHAHQRGVLHRDLKPANLLVARDPNAVPKVIDFGLARRAREADEGELRRTRNGELLGTPRYMSPEQCTGEHREPDVRVDVYGLGVVAYELLVGSSPYELDGMTLLQVVDVIRRTPPVAPELAKPGFDPDLASVLLKALAKNPDDRYDAVADLCKDLRRWLSSEPVHARRPSLTHRVRLYARRHTALFVGWTAGLAGLFVGVAAISVMLIQTRAALQRVEEAEGRAEEQTGLVEQARSDLSVLQARLDQMLSGEAREGSALLSGALVERALAARDAASTRSERRAAVTEAVERLRALAAALHGDVESDVPLASAFLSVGDLHGSEWTASAEDSAQSLPAYQESLRHVRRALANDPHNAPGNALLRRVLLRLAQTYRKQNQPSQGGPHAAEALQLARRATAGPEAPLDDFEFLVRALWARGDLHIGMPPFEQGLIDAREAVELTEARLVSEPHDPRLADLGAWSALRLALWTARLEQDNAGALVYHARSVDLFASLLDSRTERDWRELWDERAVVFFSFALWNELPLLAEEAPPTEVAERLRFVLETAHAAPDTNALRVTAPYAAYVTGLLLDLAEEEAERTELEHRLQSVFERLGAQQRTAVFEDALQLFAMGRPDGARAAVLRRRLQEQAGKEREETTDR